MCVNTCVPLCVYKHMRVCIRRVRESQRLSYADSTLVSLDDAEPEGSVPRLPVPHHVVSEVGAVSVRRTGGMPSSCM